MIYHILSCSQTNQSQRKFVFCQPLCFVLFRSWRSNNNNTSHLQNSCMPVGCAVHHSAYIPFTCMYATYVHGKMVAYQNVTPVYYMLLHRMCKITKGHTSFTVHRSKWCSSEYRREMAEFDDIKTWEYRFLLKKTMRSC